MGAARIEIFRTAGKYDRYPGAIIGTPMQVATETTSTTATTAGSRITVDTNGAYRDLTARVVVDEDCYVCAGADPEATATNSFLLKAGVPFSFQVTEGDKFSFKDVA